MFVAVTVHMRMAVPTIDDLRLSMQCAIGNTISGPGTTSTCAQALAQVFTL